MALPDGFRVLAIRVGDIKQGVGNGGWALTDGVCLLLLARPARNQAPLGIVLMRALVLRSQSVRKA